MGLEHFYRFVDRAVVDPLLAQSWESFLREHPRSRAEVRGLLAFVVEPEPDRDVMDDILARRTLRWTMKRAVPAYFLLDEVIDLVPQVKRLSPEAWSPVSETSILVAASCDAFLRRDIGEKTLWAVHNITGGEDPNNWLRLSRSESQQIGDALSYGAVEKPIFSWQSSVCLQDGYRVLRGADTRRFIGFLTRAGVENWPAPRIKADIRHRLEWTAQAVPRFRDFGLTRALTRYARTSRLAKPCTLRYFG